MPKQRSKTALILAGGGIMGAAYEIGCLTALDKLFAPGFSSRRFDIYIGVSAGSVIAALVAGRIQPAGLFRTIARNESSVLNWQRSDIYRPDWLGMARSTMGLPLGFFRIIQNYRRSRWRFGWHDLPYLIQEQFPAGLFSLEPMQDYLCNAFRQEGICDDFAELDCELYIPAYDLDDGERVLFGTPQHRDLHICQAITASCAIPFFFEPYKIGGHAYLDGSTGQIAHLDVAVEQGAKLVVLVNPRVPFHNDPQKACLPALSSGKCSQVQDLGIMLSWEQSQRIQNREKLIMSLEYYRQVHPDVDFVLLEPGPDEALLFLQGPMSFRARSQVMLHGYHMTLADLAGDFAQYAEIFARHGIASRQNRLNSPPPE
ncbi:MAG TPA: patatin-like phospholipase family protein [Desulfuromonadales bacterium]|nr:patatin-like phospholipase family protein [Desulfuromonadales bacterium]